MRVFAPTFVCAQSSKGFHMSINANAVLQSADFVWHNGEFFQTNYLRLADDHTHADDILIEATHDEREINFTRAEIENAEDCGDGSLRLKNGDVVRFLRSATVH